MFPLFKLEGVFVVITANTGVQGMSVSATTNPNNGSLMLLVLDRDRSALKGKQYEGSTFRAKKRTHSSSSVNSTVFGSVLTPVLSSSKLPTDVSTSRINNNEDAHRFGRSSRRVTALIVPGIYVNATASA